MSSEKKARKTVKELNRDLERLEVSFARLEERLKVLERIVWALVITAISALLRSFLS